MIMKIAVFVYHDENVTLLVEMRYG